MKQTKKQKRISKTWLYIGLLFFSCLLSACSGEKLDTKVQTVSDYGLTYTFQLPVNWEVQEDYQETYGLKTVFGAEDMRSKSDMYVLIFPKEQVEEEGFGERTRKELAQNNGYQKVEDVYMNTYEENDTKTYKYTFETQFDGRVVWGHFYCIFSKNGVIQFLYYSANDSKYTERVEYIDESVMTVKETSFNKEKAQKEISDNGEEHIDFSTAAYNVSITGLGTTTGSDNQNLVILRYQVTNKSNQPLISNQWENDITLTQNEKALAKGALAKDSKAYDLIELFEASQKEVQPNETKEGIVLFKLEDKKAGLSLSLQESLESEKSNYELTLPLKE